MILVCIIPVYNAEKFIKQTISSVIAQNTPEIALVFVDDGSTDNSLEIIKSLGSKHHGHIIQQKNAGVSAARNAGIDYVLNHMDANYIMFLDADDVWFPQWYDTEVEKLFSEGYDTISFDACMLTQDLKRRTKNGCAFIGMIAGGDQAIQMNSKHFAATAYKTELLRKYNIRFHEGQRLGEDLDFKLESMALSNKCYFTEKLVYGYRENIESVSHSSFTALQHYADLISGWIKSDQNISENGGSSRSALRAATYYIDDMIRDAVRDGESIEDITIVLSRFQNLIQNKCPEMTVEQYVQKYSAAWILKQRLIGFLDRIRRRVFALSPIRNTLNLKKYPIKCDTFDNI